MIKWIAHLYWRWKTKRLAVQGKDEIPFTRLRVPLAEAKIALITTAGVHHRHQAPFNCEAGDWTCREIAGDAADEDLMITHTHYDTTDAQADLDAVFPLRRLRELAAEGIIGAVSPVHYGLMGYIPECAPLVERTAPEMARTLKAAGVHAVVASPG